MLYHKETYKLKEYFNNLLGYNLYDLFPKIKENLQEKKMEKYFSNKDYRMLYYDSFFKTFANIYSIYASYFI